MPNKARRPCCSLRRNQMSLRSLETEASSSIHAMTFPGHVVLRCGNSTTRMFGGFDALQLCSSRGPSMAPWRRPQDESSRNFMDGLRSCLWVSSGGQDTSTIFGWAYLTLRFHRSTLFWELSCRNSAIARRLIRENWTMRQVTR